MAKMLGGHADALPKRIKTAKGPTRAGNAIAMKSGSAYTILKRSLVERAMSHLFRVMRNTIRHYNSNARLRPSWQVLIRRLNEGNSLHFQGQLLARWRSSVRLRNGPLIGGDRN
jgi:hypothetical protein